MTPSAERILSQLRALPLEEQKRVWEAVKEDMLAAVQARRIEAAQRIQGKYKDLMSSSEEFTALKREEVELEERHYQERLRYRAEGA